MHTNSLAIFAEIRVTMCASEPFSMDRLNAPVTDRSGVYYPGEVLFEILSIAIPVLVLTSRHVVDWYEERKRIFDWTVHGPWNLDEDMHRVVDRERGLFAI